MPAIRPFLEYFVHFCCLCVWICDKLESVDGEAARWNDRQSGKSALLWELKKIILSKRNLQVV